jgi:hypothetical protein
MFKGAEVFLNNETCLLDTALTDNRQADEDMHNIVLLEKLQTIDSTALSYKSINFSYIIDYVLMILARGVNFHCLK